MKYEYSFRKFVDIDFEGLPTIYEISRTFVSADGDFVVIAHEYKLNPDATRIQLCCENEERFLKDYYLIDEIDDSEKKREAIEFYTDLNLLRDDISEFRRKVLNYILDVCEIAKSSESPKEWHERFIEYHQVWVKRKFEKQWKLKQ